MHPYSTSSIFSKNVIKKKARDGKCEDKTSNRFHKVSALAPLGSSLFYSVTATVEAYYVPTFRKYFALIPKKRWQGRHITEITFRNSQLQLHIVLLPRWKGSLIRETHKACRLQNSRFFFPIRKARSAVSVNLACEAREASLPIPLAIFKLAPDLSFDYWPRRLC